MSDNGVQMKDLLSSVLVVSSLNFKQREVAKSYYESKIHCDGCSFSDRMSKEFLSEVRDFTSVKGVKKPKVL